MTSVAFLFKANLINIIHINDRCHSVRYFTICATLFLINNTICVLKNVVFRFKPNLKLVKLGNNTINLVLSSENMLLGSNEKVRCIDLPACEK